MRVPIACPGTVTVFHHAHHDCETVRLSTNADKCESVATRLSPPPVRLYFGSGNSGAGEGLTEEIEFPIPLKRLLEL